MKAPRFMTEYANYIKRAVLDHKSVDDAVKQLAVNRVDEAVRDYTRGMICLVDAMDSIGSVLTAVQWYGEE